MQLPFVLATGGMPITPGTQTPGTQATPGLLSARHQGRGKVFVPRPAEKTGLIPDGMSLLSDCPEDVIYSDTPVRFQTVMSAYVGKYRLDAKDGEHVPGVQALELAASLNSYGSLGFGELVTSGKISLPAVHPDGSIFYGPILLWRTRVRVSHSLLSGEGVLCLYKQRQSRRWVVDYLHVEGGFCLSTLVVPEQEQPPAA